MSDLGILSHHYQLSAELCERLNQALIVVKKQLYQLPGHEALSEEMLGEAATYLRAAVASLLVELHPDPTLPEEPPLRLPPSIIHELRAAHPASLKHYLEDLRVAHEHLLATPPQLTGRDLLCLDQMSQAVSTDLSVVYRRIRRR